jgi:pyruvate/2-oxoglutarate dehydrogenase complex dihydrolipoamide acyltransferase (E2) component
MAVEVVLPKLGFTMSEGAVSSWLVADGAAVTEGAPLYELEAEKSVQEIEAPASGTLRIITPAGETVPTGTVIASIE